MEIKGKSFGTVRDCIKYINTEQIPRENIQDIIAHEGLIFLIFYKND